MTRYFTGQAKALRTLSGGVHIVRSLVITISVFISHLEKKVYLFGSTFNGIATFQRTPLFWVTRRTGYMAKVNL